MTELEETFDDEVRAAEYVLRLLDREAEEAFENRLLSDRSLQDAVWNWETRFADLAAEIVDIPASDSVRRRLLSAIGPVPEAPRQRLFGLWPAFLGGGAVAAVLLALIFADVLPTSDGQRLAFQAELADPDGTLVLVAGVYPETHEIVFKRLVGAPAEGRVHEVWLIAEGADGPVSLGLLDAGAVTRIRVPDEIAPDVRTGTIAISDEPTGGSPLAVPSGLVLVTATFEDLT